MDCLFCKIASGEIPSLKIEEDGKHLAFLDIHPCSKGHTVVIPKKHSAAFAEMSERESAELFAFVNGVSKQIYKNLNADGLSIGTNVYEAAGQTVMHTHIHIIPRYNGDGGGSMHSIVSSCSAEEKDMKYLAQIQNQIRK
ncbi:HIT family protein [Methanolapillus millepedarum]|uniref:Protein hit n=1 Tax=Methanolapillus millepedarum TaxID=3028296 RepID=A0AA96V2X9_9EURY|nr:Protein hit [Methanosarcinaceae archaeon Ac7]